MPIYKAPRLIATKGYGIEMAKPIEPTPILRGKDAERFYKSLRDAEYSSEKEAQLERARSAYNKARSRWKVAPAK